MIRNKTRIRITWFALIISTLTIVGGFFAKFPNVILAALGVISTVTMAYVAGKTWNNQKKIENEVKN